MDDLNGRVALVTGASRGIGRAIALALAETGADVVVNYLSRAREAQEVESQIRQAGRRCIAIQADVSIRGDVDRLVAAAGPIDILINNAGIARPQAIEDITERDWDDLIDVNLKSVFPDDPGRTARYAGAPVGPHREPLFGGGPSGRSGRPPLCRVESRHSRSDALLRPAFSQGRHQGQCHRAGAD